MQEAIKNLSISSIFNVSFQFIKYEKYQWKILSSFIILSIQLSRMSHDARLSIIIKTSVFRHQIWLEPPPGWIAQVLFKFLPTWQKLNYVITISLLFIGRPLQDVFLLPLIPWIEQEGSILHVILLYDLSDVLTILS